MTEQIIMVMVGVLVTGGFNAVVTTAVIRANCDALRRDVNRNEGAITRAHVRIDSLKLGV